MRKVMKIYGASRLGYAEKSNDLLALVERLDYQYVDTAPTYPGSEVALGKFLKSRGSELQVFTKFGRGEITRLEDSLVHSLEKSLERLGVDSIYGLSIHNVPVNDKNYDLLEQLQSLKREGVISKFGYSGDWKFVPVDLVSNLDYLMVPVNPFVDQIYKKLDSIRGDTIAMNVFANIFWNYRKWGYLRTIYNAKVKRKFNPAPKYNFALVEEELKQIDGLLRFALSHNKITGICIASNSQDHLISNSRELRNLSELLEIDFN